MASRLPPRMLWNQKSVASGNTYYTPAMTFAEFLTWSMQLDYSGITSATWDIQATNNPALSLPVPQNADQFDSNSIPRPAGCPAISWTSLLPSATAYTLPTSTSPIITAYDGSCFTGVRGVLVVTTAASGVVSCFVQGTVA